MSDTELKHGILGWTAEDGSLSDELLWAYVHNRMTRAEVEMAILARRAEVGPAAIASNNT
jgi:hypothetical protein